MEIQTVGFCPSISTADVEGTIFIKLPKGFELDSKNNRTRHVLELLKNIYGLKRSRQSLEQTTAHGDN